MPSLSELLRESPAEDHEYFRSQGGEVAEPGPETEPHEPDDAEPAGDPDAGDDLKPERVKPDDAEPAEAEPEPAEAADKQGKVPFHALHEERERRKELQAKLDGEAAKIARMEGRFQQLVQGLQGQQQQAQGQQRPPTVDEDPIAALRTLEQERHARAQYEAQAQQRAAFENVVSQHEQQFLRTTPDYADAAKYWTDRRDSDLQAMGITDAAYRRQLVWQEAAGLANNALQQGKNPAEVAYNLARTWGYQPPGQRQAAEQTSSAEQKIEAAQKGQSAGRSLSSGGGSSPQGLTLEAVANLSDEEFSKLSDAKWAKLWGG